MEQDKYLFEYLRFKAKCVALKMFEIEEIIKLFEVWIKSNE